MGGVASSIICLFLENHTQNGWLIVKTHLLKSLHIY